MSTAELINAGILMGIIHVITGPDHLSALATLCGTNIQFRGRRASREAFCLGVRWGLGHSVGLIVVGGILIAVEEGLGQEWIGTNTVVGMILEGFVGLFMLALGTYGIVRANKNKRERAWPMNDLSLRLQSRRGSETSRGSRGSDKSLDSLKHDNSDDEMENLDDSIVARMEDILEVNSRHGSICDNLSHCLSIDTSKEVDSQGIIRNDSFVTVTLQHQRRPAQMSSFDQHQRQESPDMVAVVTVPMKQSLSPSQQQMQRQISTKPHSNLMSATSLMIKHTQNRPIFNDDRGDAWLDPQDNSCGNMGRRFLQCNPGLIAVATGLVHGVAGLGGVLGVIPAVQLHDAWLACVYLLTFCVTSTFTMGGFAAFYGSLSQWLAGGDVMKGGSRVFMVEMGSALLSIAVGLVWLTLLTIGKLDNVFS